MWDDATLHAPESGIEASEGFVADFLTRMATQSGTSRVHVIAHSMGNRGLLRAIDRIATAAAKDAKVPFNQIILAAADVDRDHHDVPPVGEHRLPVALSSGRNFWIVVNTTPPASTASFARRSARLACTPLCRL